MERATDLIPHRQDLRGVRRAKQLTQADLAKRACVSIRLIGALERGEKADDVTLSCLNRLAHALDLSPWALLRSRDLRTLP
jgi:transcriptional regulator with XRE-family HTH domain